MRGHELLLVALDIMFLFIILFLLAFLAIRYDANKGLGEQDYVRFNTLLTERGDIDGDYTSVNYMAIVLRRNAIDLYRYQARQTNFMGTFQSLQQFIENEIFDKNLIYVIYEREKSPLFSEILRFFVLEGIPVGIAQVST